YTGVDPRTMKPVYVPTNPHEKAMQRALIQYRNPKNYDLVLEALTIAERLDLVGFEKHCLIRPKNTDYRNRNAGKRGSYGSNKKKSTTDEKDEKRHVNKKRANNGKSSGNNKRARDGRNAQKNPAAAQNTQNKKKKSPIRNKH
ncbi:MAG: DUF3362 domain-containing protein, partial [Eubacteriales bacterium]